MSKVNYRGRIARTFQGHDLGCRERQYRSVFFRGNRFYGCESHGTESLPTVILDALVLRGVEDDSEVIARLATSAKFRGASMRHREAILARHVDIDRLFGAYTWETLPTRYLRAYVPVEKMRRTDDRARKRAGKPWPQPQGVTV